jgi:phage/plasmid-like protein (TIGR03299 family)
VIVPGDEVEKFLLLSNSHDGKVAVRVGYTPIRVVCANTLAAAHGSEASQLIRVQHTRRVAEAVRDVREIVNLADQNFEATADQFRFLATRGVDHDDLVRYVKQTFRLCVDQSDEAATAAAVKKTPTYQKVEALFTSGRGMRELKAVRGTWWAAYNAVTEFLGHERGKDPSIRLDNLWFGDAANTNQRALALAVDFAKAA